LVWRRAVESTEPLWGCTGCRQCTSYCEHGVEPGLALFAGRAEATARGAPHPALADYPDRFRAREVRLVRQLKEQIPRARFAQEAMFAYFPGCDAIDKNIAGIAETLDLFDTIDAKHIRLVDMGQACAGYPLLAAGYPDMFRWHAGKVAAELKRYRTVVVNCSACVFALRALYPAEGISVNTEILHLSELLAQSLDRFLVPREKKPVYYHDPCYLARHAGIVEAPRRALGRVVEVREFSWARADTECCGGAGVLPKTMPRVADSMARRRLGEIARKGGGTVVTSCGTCYHMLKRNAPPGVNVRDLPGALMDAIRTAQAEEEGSQ